MEELFGTRTLEYQETPNGDGEFNSRDLVLAFIAGEFEDEIPNNSSKQDGDFNGDGDFDSTDLVFAFQQGNYSSASTESILSPSKYFKRARHSRSPIEPNISDIFFRLSSVED